MAKPADKPHVWAAFASGVATQLGEEEQAERSKRRQWAAAAAQSEQARSVLLANLSGEVERWAACEHRRLLPLQAHAPGGADLSECFGMGSWGGVNPYE